MVAQTLMSGDDIDKALQDAMYPMAMQMNIYGGEDGIRSMLANNDDNPRSGRNYQAMFDMFGLDPNNDADVELLAGLISAFGDSGGIDVDENGDEFIEPPVFRVIVGRRDGFPSVHVTYASTAADSTRMITIEDDRISIVNSSFENRNDAVEGQGVTMLMRQTQAARQLGKRLGLPVHVMTEALSTKDKEYIGVHVWPKMGYLFELNRFNNPWLAEEVIKRGFSSTNTVDLMTERNSAGELGYDAWPDIVTQIVRDVGMTTFKGRMVPTDDADVGVQLMMEYGRKKSLVKEAMPPRSGKMNDIFYLTPADDQQLRNAWLTLASARG